MLCCVISLKIWKQALWGVLLCEKKEADATQKTEENQQNKRNYLQTSLDENSQCYEQTLLSARLWWKTMLTRGLNLDSGADDDDSLGGT